MYSVRCLILFYISCYLSRWTEGIICLIYKNKGDANNSDNYRGIAVLNCFGKLFNFVLDYRLNCYLEKHECLM